VNLIARHDLSAFEIDEIENDLYAFNSRATGRADAASMGFEIRGATGERIAVATGFSWAGIAEIKQMWVDGPHRGLGHGRTLLNAMICEARARGVRRIWVASFEFQAPAMYEKAGFLSMADLAGWPEGHRHIVLCLTLQ